MRKSLACVTGTTLLALAAVPAVRAQEDLKADCARQARSGGYAICARAVAQAPTDAQLRRHYAISLSHAGGYDRAIEQFRRITELTPNDPVAHFEYGWMLAFVRRYADAAAPLERAIDLKPDYRRALMIAAIVHAQLGRPDRQLRVSLAAARLGDPVAMFDSYELFHFGKGTTRNEAAAFLWLRRAAVAGHVGAMDRLVRVYLDGTMGQAQDLKAAARWATRARAARTGDAVAPRAR